MRAVTIAKLKATLSAELRRVRAGESVTVLDRTTPVALLAPVPEAVRVVRAPQTPYAYRTLTPLIVRDPLPYLDEERGEAWWHTSTPRLCCVLSYWVRNRSGGTVSP
jgi:antitoxin (DNA-binding transcriptional repressor) of toxin-antitoxin stability system